MVPLQRNQQLVNRNVVLKKAYLCSSFCFPKAAGWNFVNKFLLIVLPCAKSFTPRKLKLELFYSCFLVSDESQRQIHVLSIVIKEPKQFEKSQSNTFLHNVQKSRNPFGRKFSHTQIVINNAKHPFRGDAQYFCYTFESILMVT